MFDKLLGTPCIRPGCAQRNPKEAEFCEKCGISLAFNRPAILDGNRWSPAQDELAVFFKTRNLKGLFTRNLHVPSGMVGWVLQGQESRTLEEGEDTTQTLFERLNNFFRDNKGEVLICRRDAIAVPFSFGDIASAELLDIQANLTLRLRVTDVLQFRTRFMLQEGAVTVAALQALLQGPVRQALADHIGARHIDEMARDPDFRGKVDNALARGLKPALDNLGLSLEQGTEVGLRHDVQDEQNQLRARLWLLRRKADLELQHDKALDEIYDQQQWAKIKRREADLRRRHHEGKLTAEEADLAHTLRLGEVLQYERILEASTREEAARLGAADKVAELDDQYQCRARERGQRALGDKWQAEDEQARWKHVRELAGIQRDGELRATRARRDEQEALDQERARNSLDRLRAQEALDAAQRMDNEAERRLQQGIHLERLAKAAVREQQLAQAESQIAISDLSFGQELRHRTEQRSQAYEDAVVDERVRDLKRKGDAEDIKIRMGTLSELARIDNQIEGNATHLELHKQRETMRIAAEAADLVIEREIKLRSQKLKEDLARQALEVERTNYLGSLPIEALVALADSPEKVAGLVKLGSTRVFEHMAPEQIRAVQGTAAPVSMPAAPLTPSGRDSTTPGIDDQVAARVDQLHKVFEGFADRSQRQQTEAMSALTNAIGEVRATAIGVAQATAGVAQPAPAAPAAPAPVAPTVVFAAVPPPAAHAIHTMPLAMTNCPRCNTANLATARFCGNCSHTLD